ncbi:hypothetical protein Tco_0004180 [Tanacetum coccineum]
MSNPEGELLREITVLVVEGVEEEEVKEAVMASCIWRWKAKSRSESAVMAVVSSRRCSERRSNVSSSMMTSMVMTDDTSAEMK